MGAKFKRRILSIDGGGIRGDHSGDGSQAH